MNKIISYFKHANKTISEGEPESKIIHIYQAFPKEIISDEEPEKPKRIYQTKQKLIPDNDFSQNASKLFEKMIIGFKDEKSKLQKKALVRLF